MENVEKIICCDRGHDDNAMAAAILANGARRYENNDALYALLAQRRDNDPMAMAAMMGGGFGANQWMNNPFAYMMMMSWMRMFGNGDGWGGRDGQNAQNIELQNQIQSLRSQLQDNQNTSLLRDALGDGFSRNDFALSQLAQNLNVDFNSLKDVVCNIQASIQQVAGQVGFSAERVINAANLGDMNIITALKDCCCGVKELVQRQGYENQLGQKDIQFTTQRGFGELGYKLQGGLDFVNRSVERGFAASDFNAERNKCDIVNAGNANTQRIIDTLTTHWNTEQANKIQDLKFELSQERQNNLILGRLNSLYGGGQCGCGNGVQGL